jgi:hypothetical protein
MIEHETFRTLLFDAAHWEFEIFVTLVIDGVVLGLFWPFIRKHWYHHLNRDARDKIVAELYTEECPWCGSLKKTHSDVAWQAHQNFQNGKSPKPIIRTHAPNCPCDVCGLKRAEEGVQS